MANFRVHSESWSTAVTSVVTLLIFAGHIRCVFHVHEKQGVLGDSWAFSVVFGDILRSPNKARRWVMSFPPSFSFSIIACPLSKALIINKRNSSK